MSLSEALVLAIVGLGILAMILRGSGGLGAPTPPRTSRGDTVGPAFWLAWAARRRAKRP